MTKHYRPSRPFLELQDDLPRTKRNPTNVGKHQRLRPWSVDDSNVFATDSQPKPTSIKAHKLRSVVMGTKRYGLLAALAITLFTSKFHTPQLAGIRVYYVQQKASENIAYPHGLHVTASLTISQDSARTPNVEHNNDMGKGKHGGRRDNDYNRRTNQGTIEMSMRPNRMFDQRMRATQSTIQPQNTSPTRIYNRDSVGKEQAGSRIRGKAITRSSQGTPRSVKTEASVFKFCTQPILGDISNSTGHIDIWYQCQGSEYDRLTTGLRRFVSQHEHDSPTWGRRSYPLPDDSNVLIFGNSHARQIGLALACQHAQRLIQVVRYDMHLPDAYMAQRFVFANNSTLFVAANSYAAYSPYWQELLERQIDARLQDMDAVFLGQFNRNKGLSNFVLNMRLMMERVPPEYEVHVGNAPPTVRDVTAALGDEKPLAFVTMFGDYLRSQVRRAAEQVQETNAEFWDARRYISQMGMEGGSASKVEPGVCYNNPSNQETLRMHRCMGRKGGHPDLLAWDVSEFVFYRLGKN